MESETAWRGAYSTDYLTFESNPPRSDRIAPGAALPLTRAVPLIVILLISLISLGLWASIWWYGLD